MTHDFRNREQDPDDAEKRVPSPTTTHSPSPTRQSSLTASVLRLTTGRGAAIAIGIVTAPIVSRMYTPECFGIMELTIAMMVFLYPSCNGFGYGLALPLASTPSQLRALYALSTLLGVLVTVVIGVVAVLWGPAIVTFLGYPEIADYTIVAPMLCATFVFRNLVDFLLSCQKRFGIVALRSVFEVIGRRVVHIALGFTALRNTATGLLSGVVAGGVTGAMGCSWTTVRAVWHADGSPFRWADLKVVAVRFRNFPLFRFWNEMLMAAAYALPALLLGFLFSVKVVGYYAFGRPLLFLPLNLLTRASRDVFFVEAAEAAKHGHPAGPAALHTLRLLTVMMAFPFTVVCLLGAFIFQTAFGPEWREAGIYTQLLLPGVAITAVGMPISAVFDAKNKMGEGLFLSVVLVVIQGAGMVLGSLTCDPNSVACPRIALALSSAGTVVVWMYVMSRALVICEASRRKAARILTLPYVEAGLLLLPAAVLYWLLRLPIATFAALAVACAVQAFILHRRYPGISRKVKKVLGFKPEEPTCDSTNPLP